MLGTFGILDYVVLAGTFLISTLIGLYYGCIKTQKTNSDLLVGGRNMAILPSSLSLLATYMSAILVLGYTGEIYSNGTLISEVILGCIIFVPLGGLLFLPTLYNLKLTSVYQYLEMRFDSTTVRLIATATFMLQTTMYLGVVLFAPALALKAIVDFPVEYAMLGVGGCAAIYTAIGGLKAVVWTDAFQIMMMLAGMLSIIVEGSIRLGGLDKAFKIADDHGRIDFFRFDTDPFIRHTSLGLMFGQGVGWMSSFGCNQMTVQRYCSMSSFRRAFISLLIAMPLVVLTMSLASLSGVVIFANYADCDPLSLGKISRSDQIAPYFVVEHLSVHPGLLGLFISCLFSGSLSTLSSGINSLAAVLVEDFFKRIACFRTLSDGHQGIITKATGLLFGLVAIGMGFIVKNLGGVLQATIVVNGSVTGPLLGIFILGILLPFTNKYGAITGMLVGHALTLFVSVGSLVALDKPMRTLPLSTEKCDDETWNSYNHTQVINKQNEWALPQPEFQWPEKIYSISYLWYPLIGSTITVVVGCIVSVFTGCTELNKSMEPYVHPLIVYVNRKIRGTRTRGTKSRCKDPEHDANFNVTKNENKPGQNTELSEATSHNGGHVNNGFQQQEL